jgi:hypothetical protein
MAIAGLVREVERLRAPLSLVGIQVGYTRLPEQVRGVKSRPVVLSGGSGRHQGGEPARLEDG